MIWENLAHDKQWYFCGTKILEVARSGIFVARSGKLPFPKGEGEKRTQRKLKHTMWKCLQHFLNTKAQRHKGEKVTNCRG
jgi:hypothetical protein